jgi:hypothetical protein
MLKELQRAQADLEKMMEITLGEVSPSEAPRAATRILSLDALIRWNDRLRIKTSFPGKHVVSKTVYMTISSHPGINEDDYVVVPWKKIQLTLTLLDTPPGFIWIHGLVMRKGMPSFYAAGETDLYTDHRTFTERESRVSDFRSFSGFLRNSDPHC